jgi:transketolase
LGFGWEVKEIDGHSFNEIIGILSKLPLKTGKPSVIIAHTIKGLGGVPVHVNQVSSQYKPPSEEEAHEAIKKLNIE